MSKETVVNETKENSNRDMGIDTLLSSLYILNEMNVEHFTLDESKEYGYRVFGVSRQLIDSYIKSYEPKLYEEIFPREEVNNQ